MKMFSHEARRRARKATHDLEQIQGTIAAYESPDPRLGGTPEALPLIARLMLSYASGYVAEYEALSGDGGAPPRLRLQALEVLCQARLLHELLTRLSASADDECVGQAAT